MSRPSKAPRRYRRPSWENWVKAEIDRRVERQLVAFAKGLAVEMRHVVGDAEARMAACVDRAAADTLRQAKKYPVLPRSPVKSIGSARGRFGRS